MGESVPLWHPLWKRVGESVPLWHPLWKRVGESVPLWHPLWKRVGESVPLWHPLWKRVGESVPLWYPLWKRVGESVPLWHPLCKRVGESVPLWHPLWKRVGESVPLWHPLWKRVGESVPLWHPLWKRVGESVPLWHPLWKRVGESVPLWHPLCKRVGESVPLWHPLWKRVGESVPLWHPLCKRVGESVPLWHPLCKRVGESVPLWHPLGGVSTPLTPPLHLQTGFHLLDWYSFYCIFVLLISSLHRITAVYAQNDICVHVHNIVHHDTLLAVCAPWAVQTIGKRRPTVASIWANVSDVGPDWSQRWTNIQHKRVTGACQNPSQHGWPVIRDVPWNDTRRYFSKKITKSFKYDNKSRMSETTHFAILLRTNWKHCIRHYYITITKVDSLIGAFNFKSFKLMRLWLIHAVKQSIDNCFYPSDLKEENWI